jgi:hypothetical protein
MANSKIKQLTSGADFIVKKVITLKQKSYMFFLEELHVLIARSIAMFQLFSILIILCTIVYNGIIYASENNEIKQTTKIVNGHVINCKKTEFDTIAIIKNSSLFSINNNKSTLYDNDSENSNDSEDSQEINTMLLENNSICSILENTTIKNLELSASSQCEINKVIIDTLTLNNPESYPESYTQKTKIDIKDSVINHLIIHTDQHFDLKKYNFNSSITDATTIQIHNTLDTDNNTLDTDIARSIFSYKKKKQQDNTFSSHNKKKKISSFKEDCFIGFFIVSCFLLLFQMK